MNDFQREYDSLSALRSKKYELAKECEKEEARMKELWADLFEIEEKPANNIGDRISSMIKMGMGAFDGVMLCWKLYHKYGSVFKKWKRR